MRQLKIIPGKLGGAMKVVIYGPEGIGKSTLAAKFPRPLFIDTEGSTRHMDVQRTERPTSWPCSWSWSAASKQTLACAPHW